MVVRKNLAFRNAVGVHPGVAWHRCSVATLGLLKLGVNGTFRENDKGPKQELGELE